jgi:ankyrin repeat protein
MSDEINRENDHSESSSKYKSQNCILDHVNSQGFTPFFFAVINDYLDIAAMLLHDNMSNINHTDSFGDTALHWAVMLDRPNTVSFLLDNRAEKKIQNDN